MTMKKVLWISRHQMTEAQFKDLERALGDEVSLLNWTETVTELAALRPWLEQADVVAAVLPPELFSQLLQAARHKPVLQAAAKRVPTGRVYRNANGAAEAEFRFVHAGWQQILKLDMQVKAL